MARCILALDLGSHTLKAALLQSTLRDCAVLGLFQARREHNRTLAEQVHELCAIPMPSGTTVLSCLPGDVVTHRVLSLPFARPHQLDQVIPFELENQIPLGLEEVLVDFQVVRRTTSGVEVLAVAVPRYALAEHLDALAQAQLDPAVVGLAPLAPLSLLHMVQEDLTGMVGLLDIGEKRTSVVLLRAGTLYGLRTLSLGLGQVGGFTAFLQELRWTLLALGQDGPLLPARFFLCGGGAYIGQLRDELEHTLDTPVIPVQQLTLPAVPESYRESQGLFAVSLGLGFHAALGGPVPRINLRRGDFAYQGRREAWRREWGRLGWIAASVGAAAGLALAVDMYRLHTRYETLRHEIRRVFTATLPEVQTIVNEKLQLQSAVSTLQQRQQLVSGQIEVSPLELLRQLSSALPEQVKLDLDEWVFDGEAVRLRGTTDSFDSAESIKTAAARLVPFREVQLKDVKAAPGGERISFNLHLFVDQQGN